MSETMPISGQQIRKCATCGAPMHGASTSKGPVWTCPLGHQEGDGAGRRPGDIKCPHCEKLFMPSEAL